MFPVMISLVLSIVFLNTQNGLAAQELVVEEYNIESF